MPHTSQPSLSIAARPVQATIPADRLPLLVTGVAGVPGYNAFYYLRQRYPGRVYGIRQKDNWRLSVDGVFPCDAEDAASVAELFDRFGFRSVLNCAGACNLKSCEMDPALAYRVNVDGVRSMLPHVRAGDLRLVHLSVDHVFSGLRPGGYTEDDPPDPLTIYGKSMAAAERVVAEACPAACVARISLPMGVSFNGHAGAIDWIASRFQKHKPATLYFDELRTPTYTSCQNRLFETLLANDLSGLFHAGGPRRLTLHQIGQVINRVGGFDPQLLLGCPRVEAGPMPPRAGDICMDSSRLTAALGCAPFDPWPLEEAWSPTGLDWHIDRGAHLPPGSPELLTTLLRRHPLRPEEGYPPAKRPHHAVAGPRK